MKKHFLLPVLILVILFGTSLLLGAAPAENDKNIPAAPQQEPLTQNTEVSQASETVEADSSLQENTSVDDAADQETEELIEPESPAAAAPEQNVLQMARVTANGLNVRSGPSTEYGIIHVLPAGQTVEVLSERNSWLEVKLHGGRTGWVSARYTSRFTRDPHSPEGSLAGKVIVLDPGHGGRDPGAVGARGLREKDVVLDVSLRVAESLRAHGAEVILTRSSDTFIGLSRRVSIAEAARADIYVSIHANAHPNRQIGGTETYYFRNKANANASFTLANHLQRELVSTLGLRDIGVKHGSFLVIRQTSMPSALVELGFLSNAREEERMRTDDFRRHSADAVVRGLLAYFS